MTVTLPPPPEIRASAVPVFSFAGFAQKHPHFSISPHASPDFEQICSGEWLDWYALSPQQRWSESQKLWGTFLALGGSLDPEPDTQSPFYDAEASGEDTAHGRSGLRVVRRSGV